MKHEHYITTRHLTGEAPPVVDRCLPGSQPESYHLYHPKDKRGPSKHLSGFLHHSIESGAARFARQASPKQEEDNPKCITERKRETSTVLKTIISPDPAYLVKGCWWLATAEVQ